MTSQPKISVITVSFNAVDTIEETILSVINQTYPNIEYIIIDGGSTDGTVDIIKKYSNKIAYWISEPDKGIYDAMNKGALKANGVYVQYLNASDRIYSINTIENIVSKLPVEKPNVVYGDIILEKEFGTFHMTPEPLENFAYTFPIYHPSSWIKRELLLKFKFDTSFKIAADFKLFHTIYYKNYSFYYIPIIFSIFEAINGISNTFAHRSWYESQIVLNKNKGLRWYINNYTFQIKEKIRRVLYHLIDIIIPQFSLKRKYNGFMRNKYIKTRL